MAAGSSNARRIKGRSADHDIFLSHSGKQKGFVSDLYEVLHSRGYSTFFDITQDSLPPSENFPTIILESAATCKLALVVLSDDFLCSKWPMFELCAFVDAQSSSAESKPDILPIFYKLSPSDLNLQQNRKKWRLKWEDFAKKDPVRVNVTKWEHALGTLRKLNGVVLNDPSKSGNGEISYTKNILLSISKILPSSIEYDMSDVRGEQRLCEIICAEFTELESSMAQPSDLTPIPKVCVLGMYGPPGSGKSTLSKCLCNRHARQFNGRAFYLELSANPTKEELVKTSKKILEQITDFSDVVDLRNATDLEQVYPHLRTYLPRSAVFLVVDNIRFHDLAIDFVQHILMFDFQAGSKVLLVAHASGVLERLYSHREVQRKCRKVKCKYAYGSVKVPSINKEEAVQILQQNVQGVWLIDEQLDPKHQKIMETVIDMSRFRHIEYLPLVVKIMGAQLWDWNDVEEWGNDMQALCNQARLCKEEAVMKVVNAIFDKLPLNLQILFLDLALFILPESCHCSPDWPIGMLSIMHERPIDKIKKDMANLQRHCFLEEGKEIRVHDMFLEFARTRPESCMYYRLDHELISVPNELLPPSEQAREKGLRAVVLELNDGHERFDFWQGFSSVKALVLRNCKSLTVLSLPVGLKSLVILNIDNCPLLSFVEAEEGMRISKSVRSFTMNNQESSISNSVRSFRRRNNEESSSCMRIQQSIVVHPRGPAPRLEMTGFALQMRWLQHLCLANTGIKRLENMSTHWPQLRQITIRESCLEYLELGKLPNLEVCTITSGAVHEKELEYFFSKDEEYGSFNVPFVISENEILSFGGKNLLAECPNLKSVCILGAYTEDENGLGTSSSSKLQELYLGNFWHGKSFPDLAKAAQSLSKVVAWDCRDLTHVNFMHRYEVLQELTLLECPSLIQVYGLDHLVSLSALIIRGCGRLQTVSKLSGLVRLQFCEVEGCDSLESVGEVRDLVRLDEFRIGRGCPKLQMLHSDLQTLTHLTHLTYYQHAFQPGVLQLTNFERLKHLAVKYALNSTGTLISLGNLPSLDTLEITPYFEDEDEEKSCHYNYCNSCHDSYCNSCEKRELDVAGLLGMSHLSNVFHTRDMRIKVKGVRSLASLNGIGFFLYLTNLRLSDLPNLTSLNGIGGLQALQNLHICKLQNLTSLNGIGGLQALENLHICNLQNLTSLNGIGGLQALENLKIYYLQNLICLDEMETLTHLQDLEIRRCQSIEKLPSLSVMRELRVLTLTNCSKLKGVQDGYIASGSLKSLCSTQCKEMTHFPYFGDLSQLHNLQVEGSKFASNNVDRLVQWAMPPKSSTDVYLLKELQTKDGSKFTSIADCSQAREESMRIVSPDCIPAITLQEASIRALFWEFCHNICDAEKQMRMGKMVLERAGVEIIDRLIPNAQEVLGNLT